MTTLPSVLTPKNRWRPLLLIALLTLAILMISVFSLVSGQSTIFQNLFYFPIILACVYYAKRGLVFSVILACSYFSLMLIFSQDPVVLEGAATRVLFFVVVAAVITYLSIVRIRAEDTLQETEGEIRLLLDSTAEAIYRIDMKGNCTFCNSACLRLLGYRRPDELLGKNMHWQIHSKRLDGSPFPMEQCRIVQGFHNGKGVHVDDEVFWRSDDTPFPAEYWSYPILHDGIATGAVVTFLDITERKQTEEKTLRERVFFDRLVETAPEAIAITGAEGRVLRVNAEFVRMFGYGTDEAVGKCIDDLVASPAQLEEARTITRSTSQGEEILLETVRRRKDGTLLDVSLIVTPILIAGKQEAVYAIYRDITDRKQAEANLQEARDMAEGYLNVAAEVIITLDAQGTITLLNDTGHRLLGYEPGELIGKDWFDTCVPIEARTEVRGDFAKLIAGEGASVLTHENPVITRNGDRLALLWHNALLRDANGRIVGTLSSAQDITARKQAEDALENERLLLRALIDNIPDSIYMKDRSSRKTLANPAEVRNMGARTEADVLGKDDFSVYPREFAENSFADDQLVMQTGEPVLNREEYVVDEQGQKRWLLSSKLPLRNREGQITGLLGIGRDITARKQAEDALEDGRLLLRALIDNIPDSIYMKDRSSRKTLANPAEVRNMGARTEADVLGKDDFSVYPRELAERFFADDQLVMQAGEPVLNREEYVVDEQGQKRWLLSSKLPLRNREGQITGLLGIGRDITARKKADEDAQRERAFFDQLVETSPEAIAITDTQSRVMRVNVEFVHMFGYRVDEAVGQDIDDLVAPPAFEQEAREVSASTQQGKTVLLEATRRRKDGSLLDVSIIAAPVLIAGEHEANYAIYRDITARKEMEQKVEEMATHDFLTGLPNRRLLLDRFTIAAALARRNKARIVVMSFDLDKFKAVNDTFGHDAGDQVLKAVAMRLAGTIRACDTLARIGGDEFMVVMMETGQTGGVTAMARKVLNSFAVPLSVGGHQIRLTISIGIATYPEDAKDLETLTKKSDAAMYYSKSHGGNQFRLYADGNVGIV